MHTTFLKVLAFFRRDYRMETSYRFAFLFEFVTTVSPVLSIYFVAKLVDCGAPETVTAYGGGYFAFALIGVAISQYFVVALGSFAAAIGRSQVEGCLEAILSTRTGAKTVVGCLCAYSFLTKTVHVLLFLLGGMLLGVSYRQSNLLAATVICVLTVGAFSGLGMLSAAFILVFKKGQPITWLITSANGVLGGALFPVSVLPGWLKAVSGILPTTYALEAVRLAILKGHSLTQVWPQALILFIMACMFIPLGLFSFAKAVEKGRRDGSLMQY